MKAISNKKKRNSRSKGIRAERYYAQIFRELGYHKCVTARYGSRMHDDAGIDLLHLPINVQIKAGQQRNINIQHVIKDIKEKIKNIEEDHKPLIIIRRHDVKKGQRRTDTDELVHMTFNDFIKLLTNYGNKTSTNKKLLQPSSSKPKLT